MPIVWPPSLPQGPLNGFVDTIGEARVRTQTDAGPAKMRPRYTESIDPMTWPLALTETQWGALKTFYKTTLANGSLAFDITHPESGATVSVRIVNPLSFQHVSGDLYRGSVAFEVLP